MEKTTYCDKCGRHVPLSNDAVFIHALYSDGDPRYAANHRRHFLPVDGCEGSPSRAQYIAGQPRDRRGYPYLESEEAAWRGAYAAAQEQGRLQEGV